MVSIYESNTATRKKTRVSRIVYLDVLYWVEVFGVEAGLPYFFLLLGRTDNSERQ